MSTFVPILNSNQARHFQAIEFCLARTDGDDDDEPANSTACLVICKPLETKRRTYASSSWTERRLEASKVKKKCHLIYLAAFQFPVGRQFCFWAQPTRCFGATEAVESIKFDSLRATWWLASAEGALFSLWSALASRKETTTTTTGSKVQQTRHKLNQLEPLCLAGQFA